jgi:hypothetical protein
MSTIIDRIEFHSPIHMEGSWGHRTVAEQAKSSMILYLDSSNGGDIEWEIPDLEMVEYIGLTFEFDAKGRRTLVDYDGVMSIPEQALDLLEKHGVDVSEMRETMAA